MPVDIAEVLLKYSVVTGSAGNSVVGTALGSHGKYISTTQWTGGVANDLFDDVTGTENAASGVEYKCLFMHNNDGALSMTLTTIWISAEVSGGTSIALGVDTTASSAIGSAGAQAVLVANEDTAPAGISFSSPTTDGTGIALGTIAPGSCKAFWVRRTAANNSAVAADGFTLGYGWDTL